MKFNHKRQETNGSLGKKRQRTELLLQADLLEGGGESSTDRPN